MTHYRRVPGQAGESYFGTTRYPHAASLATGAILNNLAGTISGTIGSVQGSALLWHAASTAFLDSSRAAAIGTTRTNGLTIANTTAAANGAQQRSLAAMFSSRGWSTDSSASRAVDFAIDVLPVQGAAAPTGSLLFASSVNGAAYATGMALTSGKILQIDPNGVGPATITGGEADSATAVGVILDSTNALSTAGSLILSLRTGGVQKLKVTPTGLLVANGGVSAAGDPGAGVSGEFRLTNTAIAASTNTGLLTNFPDGYTANAAKYAKVWTADGVAGIIAIWPIT